MADIKRQSSRAIIFFEDGIISMYREFNGRKFYTFPGGGIESGESETDCVVREVFEEFGITVKPIKKVYTYESERNLEHYFLCEWLGGTLFTGQGEEFQANPNRGLYKPTIIDINEIPNLPLMPPEIAKAFFDDYKQNGEQIRESVKAVKVVKT